MRERKKKSFKERGRDERENAAVGENEEKRKNKRRSWNIKERQSSEILK